MPVSIVKSRNYQKKVRAPETGTPVMVRMQSDLLDMLDAWRREQPDIPTRSEAIRRMVELIATPKRAAR
jgi:metal-responsive CopG/Arc/MetJ family transcriptional regulator